MKTFLFTALLFLALSAHAQIITTIAGSDSSKLVDGGTAIECVLVFPSDVALDGLGNYYIADTYNNRIRKVNATGIITTIAGNDTAGYNGDNIPATAAHLWHPVGVACDNAGNIYISDSYNSRIRRINTLGIITTIAGNGVSGYTSDNVLADTTEIYNPHCLTLDGASNIYFTDFGNYRIRKIDASGIITTIAGTGVMGNTGDNGLATGAEINSPWGIVMDNSGNIYFSDYFENVVRKISASGIITRIAGKGIYGYSGDNGPADSAAFENISGLAVDNSGDLYISDVYNSRIRKVNMGSGIIVTIVGDGVHGFSGDNGPATNAKIEDPGGLVFDDAGNLYIADFGNDRIRFVTSVENVEQINQKPDIAIYPNPSTGIFSLSIYSIDQENAVAVITNSLGEKVKEITLPMAIGLNTIPIRLEQPIGVYYLSVISANETTNKIINIVK